MNCWQLLANCSCAGEYHDDHEGGWYLTTAPVIVANWKQSSKDTWTVPLGGGFGRGFLFGKQSLNARLAACYNVEKPKNASASIREA